MADLSPQKLNPMSGLGDGFGNGSASGANTQPYQGSQGSPGTATQDKIRNLSSRFDQLNAATREDTASRRDAIEARIQGLEITVNSNSQMATKKLALLKDQIGKIHDSVATEANSRAMMEQVMERKLSAASKSLMLDISKEREARERMDGSISDKLADATAELRAAVEQSRAKSSSDLDGAYRTLNQEVAAIREAIQGQTTDRDRGLADIKRDIQAKAADLKKQIEESAARRAADESTILTAVEQICSRIQAQLTAERKDREANEAAILKLLEDTYKGVSTLVDRG